MLSDEMLRLAREGIKTLKDIAKSQKAIEHELKINNRLRAVNLSQIVGEINYAQQKEMEEFVAAIATRKVE